jgi:hypothetical protein
VIASHADQDYLRQREIEERAIARMSMDPMIRDIHLEMAALYAARIEAVLAGPDGSTAGAARTSRKLSQGDQK